MDLVHNNCDDINIAWSKWKAAFLTSENNAQAFLHGSLYHQGSTSRHQHEGAPKEKSKGLELASTVGEFLQDWATCQMLD